MLLWLLKYRTLGSDKSVLMTALGTVYCCLWKWYGHKKKKNVAQKTRFIETSCQ